MLMITTCVIPVRGELNILRNKEIKLLHSGGTTSLEFMIAGKAIRALRSYWLHVPSSYDGSKAVPLVIVLHGLTDFSIDLLGFYHSFLMENYTEFSEKADEEGFIVVYPSAKLLFATFKFCWDPGYYPALAFKFLDDIGFIHDLIDKMKEEYTINLSRIYVTGFSNGAILSYSLGAYLSDIIAAIAPIAGTIGQRGSENEPFYYIPTPKNHVSVITFHGTNDSSDVLYNGSSTRASVNESISFWVEQNGCNPIPEIYTSVSGKIIQRTYTNGKNGTEVVLYTTVGGNHWWPGNSFSDPNYPWLIDTIQEISATDLMWEFFEAHPKQ